MHIMYRFRPPVQLGEQQFEHPINAALKTAMQVV